MGDVSVSGPLLSLVACGELSEHLAKTTLVKNMTFFADSPQVRVSVSDFEGCSLDESCSIYLSEVSCEPRLPILQL